MGDGVEDVVDAEAVGKAGHIGGVFGHVGVLPGIADIHVVADGDEQAAFIVEDAAPLRGAVGHLDLRAASGPAAQVAETGDGGAFVDVVEQMPGGVCGFDVEDGAVGEEAPHGIGEGFPFGTVEIVDHEEAAPKEILAEAADFEV